MSLKSILIFVLLLQHTLINTVAASVHMAAEDHQTRETPHIHSLSTLFEMFQQHSEAEHNCHDSLDEVHVHVICPLAHTLEVPQLQLQPVKPATLYQSYQGLTYQPLLPPPNA
ncbi:hypothetical protein [Bacterioplanoides sp.]|uniref:hypothetical protein n=1 Tax=Bacterioplanoides sp. TaxID=2066072 RepID=UPI003AFF7BD8